MHVAKSDDVQTILGSVAKLGGVYTTHCARSSRRCAYCSRRESRWRSYDTQCTFIRHYVSASCIVCTSRRHPCDIMHGVVRTLHVAKPNKVHATLDSGVVCIVRVEKIDVVNTTTRRSARSYDIRLIVVLTRA